MKTSNPTLIQPFISLDTEVETQQLYSNISVFFFQSEETSEEQKKPAPESLKSKY